MTNRWEPFNWYRDVRYYDIVFNQTTDDEVEFLEGVSLRHGVGGRNGLRGLRVLEPGCGSGRLVHALAQRGARVAGFDIEPQALTFARARLTKSGLRAELAEGRFDRFRCRAGTIDLAHCLYSTLLHATAAGEAERHLQLVCSALRPGGLYVLGVHLTNYSRRKPIRERADCRRGRVRVIYTLRHGLADSATRLQPIRCRLTVRTDGSPTVRRLESSWNFRTYDVKELEQLLAAEPRFELAATYDFHHDLESPNEGPRPSFDRVLVLRRIGEAIRP